ncbi:MAG TPA: V4R domain-containing protein [Myxococcota bacterium]|nr:V4R domain-containing protein [Myxococcota bacterium]
MERARLEALGIDLEGSLLDEPRFLTDPAFVGALHAELAEELGPDAATAVLFQLGFARGLFDACRVVREGFGTEHTTAPATPGPPLLAMRLAPLRNAAHGIDIEGSWPDRREAHAVVAALGAAAGPCCHASAGYTSGWLTGVLGPDLLALETECAAHGALACRFRVLEAEAWQEAGDARAAALLEAVPIPPLRELVGRQLASLPEREANEGFEAGSPAIHLWGPVMVVPFAGADESLRALELIARDRAARGVRVVIVDCSGAIIDEGFGALALERILDAVANVGAEPILAGVSPLSMPVVSELERSHVVLHKDLPEAIATAFQIAEAQRGTL